MPKVFASVSITIVLFYGATLAMAYAHLLPVGLHMLWGLFTAIMVILLQCLVFGFFIGSGKTVKRVVEENALSREWVQKTKDYKNRCYPMLMLAIVVSLSAAVVGGGVSTGSVPVWIHQVLAWAALAVNVYSLWISYQVVVENVEDIHRINDEVRLSKGKENPLPTAPAPQAEAPAESNPRKAWTASHFYFLAVAAWVPYLYMKFSLGSRTFPIWPFLALSGLFLAAGRLHHRKHGNP